MAPERQCTALYLCTPACQHGAIKTEKMLSALGAAALLSFAPSTLPSLDERSHAQGAGLCDPSVKQLSGYVRGNPTEPTARRWHALPCKLPRLAVQTEPEAGAQLFLLVLRVTRRPQERPGRPLDDRRAGLLERGRPTLSRALLSLSSPSPTPSLSRLCPMSPFAVIPALAFALALALALAHALTLARFLAGSLHLTHPCWVALPHPPSPGRALRRERAVHCRAAGRTHAPQPSLMEHEGQPLAPQHATRARPAGGRAVATGGPPPCPPCWGQGSSATQPGLLVSGLPVSTPPPRVRPDTSCQAASCGLCRPVGCAARHPAAQGLPGPTGAYRGLPGGC